ncbi:MAG: CBS domain-containing protein, partial [Candidatus Binatia bacterium]
ADESVDEAARKMAEAAVRRLPVVDGQDVVGIISLGDLAAGGSEKIGGVALKGNANPEKVSTRKRQRATH